MEQTMRARRFNEVFNLLAKEVSFNPKWGNGTGYFNYAVQGEHKVPLKHGELKKSQTPSGRRLLFVGTHLGGIVIFDRYTPQEGVFTFNEAPALSRGQWLESGAIDDPTMEFLLGLPGATSIRGGLVDAVHAVREEIITSLKKEVAV